MKNSILLLGTGTSVGVPMIGCQCEVCLSPNPKDKRYRTSAYVTYQGLKFLIDMGPDLRSQLLQHHIKEIDAILITHSHRDHVAGLDDLRALNFLFKKKFPIYANYNSWESIKKQFYYAFESSDYISLPEVEYREIISDSIIFDPARIEVLEVQHGTMNCLGYKFDSMAYITDCSFIAEPVKDKLRNLDVLILNSLRETPHHSHFSLSESLAIIEELKPKKAFLIHLSHQMGCHDDVELSLPPNVYIGYDGLDILF